MICLEEALDATMGWKSEWRHRVPQAEDLFFKEFVFQMLADCVHNEDEVVCRGGPSWSATNVLHMALGAGMLKIVHAWEGREVALVMERARNKCDGEFGMFTRWRLWACLCQVLEVPPDAYCQTVHCCS